MLRIAVLGCGRIGQMHADNVHKHPKSTLAAVYDVYKPAAQSVSDRLGVPSVESAEEIFANPDIDAVLVATATPTHADYIEQAVAAGKPVLCEKPIDLDLARVEQCKRRIEGKNSFIQLGFNRRFDPGHRAACKAKENGEIGELHQVIITSRDPAIPSTDYLKAAGGLLRDMTIHDFDLARYMLSEEPVEVFAVANALIDPELGKELDEVDSAMIIMRTASGKQCHINNSRTAVYGYDQRVELMGTDGMIISDNRKPHEVKKYSAKSVEVAEPYQLFFLERYNEAFMTSIDSFVDSIEAGRPPEVGFEDGRQALILAEAAYLSLKEQRVVLVSEITA